MDEAQLSEALKRSWETHRQAFGPILEPAFLADIQTRTVLVAALNHLSRRQVREGLELLKPLGQQCRTDADRAAWTFFVGLAFEMAGAGEQMLKWYLDAGKYGHRFYLPYMKLAKAAHASARFEDAGKWYAIAYECLKEQKDADHQLLAAAATNLVSCLTMLHRYADAEIIWQEAQRYPLRPGASATAAMLYAAMGDRRRTEECMETLRKEYPQWVSQTMGATELILRGAHPHFSEVPLEEEALLRFWERFRELEALPDDSFSRQLAQELRSAFPFLERDILPEREGKRIVFRDNHAIGLRHGLTQLIRLCPVDIRRSWAFAIEH